MSDNFKKYEDNIKDKHEHVAVCRGRFGSEPVFHIVFKNNQDLKDFLNNTDDGLCNGKFTRKHFYAKGFNKGEFCGENT